jgi:hypothetical protein
VLNDDRIRGIGHYPSRCSIPMFLRLESLISILFLGHLKLLLLAQSLHAVQDPPPEIRRAACARDAGSFGPTSRSNFPRLESVDRAESGRSVRSGGAVLVLDGPSFSQSMVATFG